jgi:hypothetical protein
MTVSRSRMNFSASMCVSLVDDDLCGSVGAHRLEIQLLMRERRRLSPAAPLKVAGRPAPGRGRPAAEPA